MIKEDLTLFLFKLADRIKAETNNRYDPTLLRSMLHDKGGLETAKYLINATKPSEGYTKLWELKRLDLTVEAQILENDGYHRLLTPKELEKCKERLTDYGYNRV